MLLCESPYNFLNNRCRILGSKHGRSAHSSWGDTQGWPAMHVSKPPPPSPQCGPILLLFLSLPPPFPPAPNPIYPVLPVILPHTMPAQPPMLVVHPHLWGVPPHPLPPLVCMWFTGDLPLCSIPTEKCYLLYHIPRSSPCLSAPPLLPLAPPTPWLGVGRICTTSPPHCPPIGFSPSLLVLPLTAPYLRRRGNSFPTGRCIGAQPGVSPFTGSSAAVISASTCT